MQALDALTLLLVGLRVHESDPRLLKVHVQRLYRDLDPRAQPGGSSAPTAAASRTSGSGGGGAKAGGGASVSFSPPPELHHQVAASDCLRCGSRAHVMSTSDGNRSRCASVSCRSGAGCE